GCAVALAGLGSVAVICADADIPATGEALRTAGLDFAVLGAGGDQEAAVESRLTLVPVTLAKGLEYDHVILVEPARIATGEAYGLRRLYVALTRAVSRLTVFHAEPLPIQLSLHTMKRGHTFWPLPAFSPCALRDQASDGILKRSGRAWSRQNYTQ
ncbi:MAG: ATP-binding domain-containing protein, partial [Trebonia sp.]